MNFLRSRDLSPVFGWKMSGDTEESSWFQISNGKLGIAQVLLTWVTGAGCQSAVRLTPPSRRSPNAEITQFNKFWCQLSMERASKLFWLFGSWFAPVNRLFHPTNLFEIIWIHHKTADPYSKCCPFPDSWIRCWYDQVKEISNEKEINLKK